MEIDLYFAEVAAGAVLAMPGARAEAALSDLGHFLRWAALSADMAVVAAVDPGDPEHHQWAAIYLSGDRRPMLQPVVQAGCARAFALLCPGVPSDPAEVTAIIQRASKALYAVARAEQGTKRADARGISGHRASLAASLSREARRRLGVED